MADSFTFERRVEFAETDLAGIVHFANYMRYMESAEHAFLRSLGFSVHGEIDGVLYGWPRVNVSCDYRQALRFEDQLRIRLLVKEIRKKALSFVHLIHRVDGDAETLVAIGQMTTVCVTIGPPMKSATIPAELSDQLQVTPTDAYAHLLVR